MIQSAEVITCLAKLATQQPHTPQLTSADCRLMRDCVDLFTAMRSFATVGPVRCADLRSVSCAGTLCAIKSGWPCLPPRDAPRSPRYRTQHDVRATAARSTQARPRGQLRHPRPRACMVEPSTAKEVSKYR